MARIASSALRRAVEEAVVEALAGTGRCARSAATALRMATVVAAVAAKARGAIHSPCCEAVNLAKTALHQPQSFKTQKKRS